MKKIVESFKSGRWRWWLNGMAASLFGSRIEIEGREKKRVKVYPFIWKGRLYLLGLQRAEVKASFASKYEVRLEAPRASALPAARHAAVARAGEKAPEVAHVVMIHLPPALTVRYLEHMRTLSPGYRIICAYGGTYGDYERIDWPDRFYVETPLMRGRSDRYSHVEVNRKALEIVERHETSEHAVVIVSDYDLLPMRAGYFDEVAVLMANAGVEYAGFRVREVGDTNNGFCAEAKGHPRFGEVLRRDGIRIFHQEGCFSAMTLRMLRTFCASSDVVEDVFHEIHDPTIAWTLGARPACLREAMDGLALVRYRPAFHLEEMLGMRARGYAFAHPFKGIEAYLDTTELRKS